MVCGRSVPVQTHGFGLWRSACSSCGDREVNMSAVPEGITSADVIVWGEGGTFAQQIAAARRKPLRVHPTGGQEFRRPPLHEPRDVCRRPLRPCRNNIFATCNNHVSPANGLQAAQYQGASSCKTVSCVSSRVWQLHLVDLRASNWRAGKRREFLYAPCLQGWGLKPRAPAAGSFREALVRRRHHSRE